MEQEDWLSTLPEEVLVNIIRFTDTQSRSDLSLVCSKFYDCVCQLERDKFPLCLSVFQVNIHLLTRNLQAFINFLPLPDD
jgi:hypothetical protein